VKILLTGVTGQLGRALIPLLETRGELVRASRSDLDLSRPGDIAARLDALAPDLIVNPAAWTAVDAAEDEVAEAMAANAEAPAVMAHWAGSNDRALVHFSTDYVFDGRKGSAYVETDATGPLNVYGRSKLEGERAVLDSGARHIVLRSSWIYAPRGANFVLTMLRLAREGRSLNIVSDQVGSPTSAASLARATVAAIDRELPSRETPGGNLYHCVDRGAVSWFEFARRIFEGAVELGLLENMPEVVETDSEGFPQKALRPEYSPLDNTLFEQASGHVMPTLDASLKACLKDILEHERNT